MPATGEETKLTGQVSRSYLHVVSWKGEQIKDVGRSFGKALNFAGLPAHYTPHILRHTRVTWLFESGKLSSEEVAAAAGMTVQMVETVYRHRSPHFQKRAAEA